jgi:hypothetical protein
MSKKKIDQEVLIRILNILNKEDADVEARIANSTLLVYGDYDGSYPYRMGAAIAVAKMALESASA